MRKVAAALVLLIATNAWAFRGRPVTDLRFDGRSQASVQFVATDGLDFLALIGSWESDQYHVFTQKIVDGRPVGPLHRIASGSPAGLGWTGTEYLAGWTENGTLRIGRISREGTLISLAPQLSFGASRLIANGEHLLAVGTSANQVTVQPLDRNGNPAGPAIAHVTTGWTLATGAGGAGFAVVFRDLGEESYQPGEMKLILLRSDGIALTPSPVVLGPYSYGRLVSVATDGIDTLIVFTEDPPDGPEVLESIVVGANGTVKARHLLYSHSGVTVGSMVPGGLAWEGSRYVVALGLQRADGNFGAATLAIARNGERIGDVSWIVERPRSQQPTVLAWNGRDLLMPFHVASTSVSDNDVGSYCVTVNPATMTGAAPVPFGRTLGSHDRLTIAAGADGYLAAWFDHGDGLTTSIRASRIDRHGNYLDGEGIVLGTMPHPRAYAVPTIAIDGNGPQWFVVWSTVDHVHGRSISRGGAGGAQTIAIGPGMEADVRWNGSRYVVLRSDRSLHQDILTADGVVESSTILAREEQIGEDRSISYSEPHVARVDGRMIGVYLKKDVACTQAMQGTYCTTDATVSGRRVDQADATPFLIAERVWGDIAVAESPTQALVLWAQYQGLRGAFVSPDAQAGPSFLIEPSGASSSVAFDGTDFVAAWGRSVARISGRGTVSARTEMRTDDAEQDFAPVIAASAFLAPLVGFLQRHVAYDSVTRGAVLFTTEIETTDIAPPHEPPRILCATRNGDDTITVRWDRVTSPILGVSIELQLSDGTFRAIGVAPSFATRAQVSLAGLEGSSVRVRSYNTGGFSPPSGLAPLIPPPQANLRWAVTACAGVPETIEILLNGTAPFHVRWDDGLVQENVMTTTATRVVTLTHDTIFTIVSVSDATCATNEIPESVRISVTPQPAIANQTGDVRIKRGETATLNVTANEGARFDWFEGARGDTSHPVGTGTRSFTTPALTASTRYWARVSNHCGSVDSQTMNVSVSGRRRSARR